MNMLFTPTLSLITTIKSPFRLDGISLNRCQADFFTKDDQFCLEVGFNANYFKNGNGYQSWKDADIEDLCSIKAYNEDGEISKFYINPMDLDLLKQTIEKEVHDRLQAV